MEGGEKGLTGVVKDVNGANVTVVLEALPGQLAIVELYKAKQLVKHFVVGDHVLIVGGKFKVWKTRKKKKTVRIVRCLKNLPKRVKPDWFRVFLKIS